MDSEIDIPLDASSESVSVRDSDNPILERFPATSVKDMDSEIDIG